MQTEKTRHLRTRVISVLLAVLMIVTCLPSMLFPVSADNNGRSGGISDTGALSSATQCYFAESTKTMSPCRRSHCLWG